MGGARLLGEGSGGRLRRFRTSRLDAWCHLKILKLEKVYIDVNIYFKKDPRTCMYFKQILCVYY